MGSSIHLAFEILQPGNLSFYLSGTPGFTQSGTNRCIFCAQAQRKAVQLLHRASAGLVEPRIELIALALAHHGNKPPSQGSGFCQSRTETIERLAIAGIAHGKLVGSTQE